MKNLKNLLKIRDYVRKNEPLIHAITNPIAINMVANAILFQEAKAICADHPDEMEDIVKISDSLSVNLGNIKSERMKAIKRAVEFANKKKIPTIIDLVGIGASRLRLDFAQKLLDENDFDIIKGNSSEILALVGKSSAKGVDVGESDEIREDKIKEFVKISSDIFKKYNTTVLMTGKTDILVRDREYFLVENGCENLSKITATGCMLTGLISTFLSYGDSIEASLLGLLILEISGELCEDDRLYTFFVNLMDNIGTLDDESIEKYAKIKRGVL